MTTATETTPIPAIATKAIAHVNTKEFTRELEWATRFVDKHIKIPILQNVLLRCEDDVITLTGTDLETAGTTTALCAGDAFSVTIPATQALKYLKKVSEPNVALVVEGSNISIYHGDDSSAAFTGLSSESFPELPVYNGETIDLIGLEQALPRVLTSISAEESRLTLNGALLQIRDAQVRMISTDGHRMSVVSLQTTCYPTPAKVIIPKFALSELARLDVDTIEFGHDENHVFFRNRNRRIVSRKLTGNFPDWERVLPQDLPCVASIDADGLRKHGERVALFADERSHCMRFELADSKLTITAGDGATGKAKACIATTWEVPTWNSGFNWCFVADFLKLAPKTAFDLRFNPLGPKDTSNPCAVVFAVPGWDYVLMPMRI